MNKMEARKAAEAARTGSQVPDDYRLQSMEQKYIEVAGQDPTQPAPVRDVLVWSAHFYGDTSQWVELCVDDSNGKIVRVLNSR